MVGLARLPWIVNSEQTLFSIRSLQLIIKRKKSVNHPEIKERRKKSFINTNTIIVIIVDRSVMLEDYTRNNNA